MLCFRWFCLVVCLFGIGFIWNDKACIQLFTTYSLHTILYLTLSVDFPLFFSPRTLIISMSDFFLLINDYPPAEPDA